MISVFPAQILLFFAGIWFVIITIMWLRDELRRSGENEWTITKEKLYTCKKCHYSFLAKDDSSNITRCPRCNEMCFLTKKKRL